jgi:uncharacterized protein (TIGR00251 family)
MSELSVQQVDNDAVFQVKIVASSSRTAVAGQLDGMLKIKVAAPPENGKANRAIVKFLAAELGVKKKQVVIASGLTSTIKQIHVSDTTTSDIEKLIQ